jgi:hypothetical protein
MNIRAQKQLLCRLLCFFDLSGGFRICLASRNFLSLSPRLYIHRDLEDLAGELGVAWLPWKPFVKLNFILVLR